MLNVGSSHESYINIFMQMSHSVPFEYFSCISLFAAPIQYIFYFAENILLNLELLFIFLSIFAITLVE